MTESLSDGVALGIYEKALVGNQLETDDDWRRFLTQVPEAGFGLGGRKRVRKTRKGPPRVWGG